MNEEQINKAMEQVKAGVRKLIAFGVAVVALVVALLLCKDPVIFGSFSAAVVSALGLYVKGNYEEHKATTTKLVGIAKSLVPGAPSEPPKP
ncbi:MAG: hypothetical protein GY923_15280 [Aestuariibacter sp.]|nr:hypothetical protein [Aestuariibacter sp.]